MTKGPLIILSGPSGSGKSTIVARLLAMPELKLRQSISATTRPPRSGERPGTDYLFVTAEEFDRLRDGGQLLEWAKVHDHCYGTPRRGVEDMREQGCPVVLVIDVQGASQVRESCPDNVSIFLRTSNLDTLERRLRDRHTEDDTAIERRLQNARVELLRADEFTHQVLNDDLDRAVNDVRTIIMNRIREEQRNAG